MTDPISSHEGVVLSSTNIRHIRYTVQDGIVADGPWKEYCYTVDGKPFPPLYGSTVDSPSVGEDIAIEDVDSYVRQYQEDERAAREVRSRVLGVTATSLAVTGLASYSIAIHESIEADAIVVPGAMSTLLLGVSALVLWDIRQSRNNVKRAEKLKAFLLDMDQEPS
jgi:hypothetical protein